MPDQPIVAFTTRAALREGPDGYISPSMYRAWLYVPTWHYIFLHLRGRPSEVAACVINALASDDAYRNAALAAAMRPVLSR